MSVVDCTRLKKALLAAKVEGGFLCLSGTEVFPVGMKESTNAIPSKLLIRSFQKEVRLIIKKLRMDRKEKHWGCGGAIFFGPSGTGKSWTGDAVLVDELTEAQESGKAVVYFDSVGQRTLVFSKERSVLIEGIDSINELFIPELMVRDTVFIYYASSGARAPLTCFPCEYLIFASPNAGNFQTVAKTHGLATFVCPNWTIEELKLLEHGYGNRRTPEEVEGRFERFGGSPRAVVANDASISETLEREAVRLLRGVDLWSDLVAVTPDWPCRLLQARYSTEKTAETPEEAYNKYMESNVIWEYANDRAMQLVHAAYDRADEEIKSVFQNWLAWEPKASALYGHWFAHVSKSLFLSATKQDVYVKMLEADETLSMDDQEYLASRELNWKFPKFKEIQDTAMLENGKKGFDLADLEKLTDPAVLYRMPEGFPLMEYFNPPNNCFSVGVGRHKVRLDHAVDLRTRVLPQQHQVNFVYVTPSKNYPRVTRWQSCGCEGRMALGKVPSTVMPVLSRMVQLCMRFKKL